MLNKSQCVRMKTTMKLFISDKLYFEPFQNVITYINVRYILCMRHFSLVCFRFHLLDLIDINNNILAQQ